MLKFAVSLSANGLKRMHLDDACTWKIAWRERERDATRTRGGGEGMLAKDEEVNEKSKSIRSIAQWLEGVKTIGSRLSVSAFPR